MEGLTLNDLKNKTVIDINGKVYGHVADILFDMQNLLIAGFVIHGGKIEEIFERFKIKADNDPFFTFDDIDRVANHSIFLNCDFRDLRTKQQAMGKDKISLFSVLMNESIFDKNNNIIAKIVDIKFLKGDTYEFILGGRDFENLLKRNECNLDLQYRVNQFDIEAINEKIRILLSAKELETKMLLPV
ncbi:MAG: PRC-barrel domain-containing protein [Candidatus Heimdallarchaeota archaeon]|nr:PRC-barrel domain-containing protein [Candidatus Heimdallarchaeota archaeon]